MQVARLNAAWDCQDSTASVGQILYDIFKFYKIINPTIKPDSKIKHLFLQHFRIEVNSMTQSFTTTKSSPWLAIGSPAACPIKCDRFERVVYHRFKHSKFSGQDWFLVLLQSCVFGLQTTHLRSNRRDYQIAQLKNAFTASYTRNEPQDTAILLSFGVWLAQEMCCQPIQETACQPFRQRLANHEKGTEANSTDPTLRNQSKYGKKWALVTCWEYLHMQAAPLIPVETEHNFHDTASYIDCESQQEDTLDLSKVHCCKVWPPGL